MRLSASLPTSRTNRVSFVITRPNLVFQNPQPVTAGGSFCCGCTLAALTTVRTHRRALIVTATRLLGDTETAHEAGAGVNMRARVIDR